MPRPKLTKEEKKQRERDRKRKQREDKRFLATENQNREKKRQNAEVRKKELAYAVGRRLNEEVRERQRKYDESRRQNEEVRDRERVCAEHRRLNEEVRERERVFVGQTSKKRKIDYDTKNVLYANYFQSICNGPTNVCFSCNGLWFPSSMSTITVEQLRKKQLTEEFVKKVFINHKNGTGQLCSTCKIYILKGKVPRLSISNGLIFPSLPKCLKNLTPVEEILISPRLPFLRIVPLGCDRQYGIKGNTVLVPTSVPRNMSILPRNLSETEFIQLAIMRKMCYKKPYALSNVRPNKVYEAVSWLVQQELYKRENITLDTEWLGTFHAQLTEYITEQTGIDFKDEVTSSADIENSEIGSSTNQVCDEEKENEIYEGSAHNVDELETMLMNIDIPDVSGPTKFAPAEGNVPISLLGDRYGEELSFPGIYGGQARHLNPDAQLTYSDIVKSEIRNADRRAAKVSKLFFSCNKLITKMARDSVNLCLRKKLRSVDVKAEQLLSSDFVEHLIQHDDGFKVLKSIRTSPAFWEQKKKSY
jgi:hypothetical protein